MVQRIFHKAFFAILAFALCCTSVIECSDVAEQNPRATRFGYTYYKKAPMGQQSCASGSTPGPSECLAAVRSILNGKKQGRTHLVHGSWGHLPPGCSVWNGDSAAHFNTGNGKNDGSFSLVCNPTNAEKYLHRCLEYHTAWGKNIHWVDVHWGGAVSGLKFVVTGTKKGHTAYGSRQIRTDASGFSTLSSGYTVVMDDAKGTCLFIVYAKLVARLKGTAQYASWKKLINVAKYTAANGRTHCHRLHVRWDANHVAQHLAIVHKSKWWTDDTIRDSFSSV